MKKAALVTFALLCAVPGAHAARPSGPSRASLRYHEARMAMTIPSYSLASVRARVRKLKADPDGSSRLNDKTFRELSFEEKFTYVMVHGEDFSQNCDESPGILQEERKIFGFTPSPFNDAAMWSDRQSAFLKENRPQVIRLMHDTIRAKGRVGSNFKHAIVDLKAVELIPDLADVYKRTRTDHDILTVMMILMKDGKYRPFLTTPIYGKLFGDNAGYAASISASPANQRLILDLAQRFYRSTRK